MHTLEAGLQDRRREFLEAAMRREAAVVEGDRARRAPGRAPSRIRCGAAASAPSSATGVLWRTTVRRG